MHVSAYRDVTAIPAARSVLILGFIVRMPMFATGIVLTLHVVSTLGRSYGEAGLVSAAFTVALAVSAPWRGRVLDRRGVRRAVAPSIVATGLVWTTLPFLPYAVLLPACVLGGFSPCPPSPSCARLSSPRCLTNGGGRPCPSTRCSSSCRS